MTTIWTGTVDNQNLAGYANGDMQPMRITEDADGRLMTEFAFSRFHGDGGTAIEYDSDNWIADSGMNFRDMQPAPDAALAARLVAAGLLDA